MQSFNNLIVFIFLIFFSILFLFSFLSTNNSYYDSSVLSRLKKYDLLNQLDLLELEVAEEKAELEKLTMIVSKFEKELNSINYEKVQNSTVIPVVVLVCNRVEALKSLISKLLKIRPSIETFPIYVSQDCNSPDILEMIKNFYIKNITYIKHTSPLENNNVVIPQNMLRYKSYYYISRHYKLILQHIFDQLNYEAAILLEDDLDVSDDIFSYFNATYHKLLISDKSLYCISAWNDNGLPELIDLKDNVGLYRTDFFPGLGWLLTKNLWMELGNRWPDGFWDDWIRKPEQRKDRMCIRPEISRTSMTKFGAEGASKGYFFRNFLSRIKLNDISVDFSNLDLSYLTEKNYEKYYMNIVYNKSKLISFNNLKTYLNQSNIIKKKNIFRVEYSTFNEYEEIAKFLEMMRDFKEGVERTAYKGIVTVFKNETRIFVAPKQNEWKGYDRKWEFIP
ncbi:Alpha-1,3-mannosyl-glycoprotein 2-beta-N-acetylglucosaminyltransferase [Strongyloides ratti]|uniref:Alpha-1,3-mannosyl-glycoprotein 2-beta-N-acetylglucosaminyltransferase n=1 Tax=Strongyloides ratti TaxID=34506 RepID=A0A090L641_STRRB|nr:Alpha-1,3-mannosyl-glycoprotein 2-beta-N-acetylglucosaminyltransferase [Strongyloides ratti]CEF63593.1 Alpha-1,3-mannosyl-glycoprotein 2-beta-N-acetylglucosaminyltransferase [Strongyloides ratti]